MADSQQLDDVGSRLEHDLVMEKKTFGVIWPAIYCGFNIPFFSMYGIFIYIWVIFRANVGNYSSTMEHMGFK